MLTVNSIRFNQNNRQVTPSFQGGYFDLTGLGASKHATEIRKVLSDAGVKFNAPSFPQAKISGSFGN